MTSTTVVTLWLMAAAALHQTVADSLNMEYMAPKGASWRVFAVDSQPLGPLAITEVQEVRQQNPPSTWAAFVRNRSTQIVTSFTLAAAVVAGDGTVKGIQPLQAIKNVKPNQNVREELRVRVTVLLPTDRVVFFVSEVTNDAGEWKAVPANVTALIKAAAKQLPVP